MALTHDEVRESVKRSEPTAKEARTIQRKAHDENQTVKKKRKVRESVKRSEPRANKEARRARENVQRS